jgi:hypothetical protein
MACPHCESTVATERSDRMELVWSAKKLSCHPLFKPIFMVQTTKNWTCHHSQMLRNTVPVSMQLHRQPWRWLRNAWTQGHMRTPLVIV